MYAFKKRWCVHFFGISQTKVVRYNVSARWLTRPTHSAMKLNSHPAFLCILFWKRHQIIQFYLLTCFNQR